MARDRAALLLDQGFVAGIGNYLRAEILFVAGVHPSRRPQDLSPDERKALARAIRAVPRQSYRTGGITNEPERARRLKARGLGRGECRHRVFARAGAVGPAAERTASRSSAAAPRSRPGRLVPFPGLVVPSRLPSQLHLDEAVPLRVGFGG